MLFRKASNFHILLSLLIVTTVGFFFKYYVDISKSNNGTSKRPKYRKETSARPLGKRVEPGNPSNRDIKSEISLESA